MSQDVSDDAVAPWHRGTVAPWQEHSKRQVGFVSAPVFARPDGMRRGEATFPAAELKMGSSFMIF